MQDQRAQSCDNNVSDGILRHRDALLSEDVRYETSSQIQQIFCCLIPELRYHVSTPQLFPEHLTILFAPWMRTEEREKTML